MLGIPYAQVMLDAAAYVPTQPLDLRKVKPDYVALSFCEPPAPSCRWPDIKKEQLCTDFKCG